jgi:hypothetical protein
VKLLHREVPAKKLEPSLKVAREPVKACAEAALSVKKSKGLFGASASSSDQSGGFFEDTSKLSIKDTLLRIRRDVERCLAWLDSGPSLSCGLVVPSTRSLKWAS